MWMYLTNIELKEARCKSNTLHNSIYMTFNSRQKQDMLLEGRTVVTLGREQRLQYIVEPLGSTRNA